jgi:hypothetical protein
MDGCDCRAQVEIVGGISKWVRPRFLHLTENMLHPTPIRKLNFFDKAVSLSTLILAKSHQTE